LDSDGTLLSLPSFPNSQPVIKYENNSGFSQLLTVKPTGSQDKRVVSKDQSQTIRKAEECNLILGSC